MSDAELDDLAALERDVEEAVRAGRVRVEAMPAEVLALATAALAVAVALPWTDPAATTGRASPTPGEREWVLAALVVIVMSVAIGVLRPRTRGTAGAVAAVAATAATVASAVAVFVAEVVAPGPVVALAAAPLVLVASSVGSWAAGDG